MRVNSRGRFRTIMREDCNKVIVIIVYLDAQVNRCEQWREADWRRGRDSNPRYSCPYFAFRVRRIRPLCHLSADRSANFDGRAGLYHGAGAGSTTIGGRKGADGVRAETGGRWRESQASGSALRASSRMDRFTEYNCQNKIARIRPKNNTISMSP